MAALVKMRKPTQQFIMGRSQQVPGAVTRVSAASVFTILHCSTSPQSSLSSSIGLRTLGVRGALEQVAVLLVRGGLEVKNSFSISIVPLPPLLIVNFAIQ